MRHGERATVPSGGGTAASFVEAYVATQRGTVSNTVLPPSDGCAKTGGVRHGYCGLSGRVRMKRCERGGRGEGMGTTLAPSFFFEAFIARR